MDRHIARTIVRNSAGDARVIWSIFSGYHPQGLRDRVSSNNFFLKFMLNLPEFLNCTELGHMLFYPGTVNEN